MLLCLGFIAVLLYDTVFGSVTNCVYTFDKAPGRIEAHSRHLDGNRPRCEYWLRAPTDTTIVVNITLLHGFDFLDSWPAESSGSHCLPSLQIAEVGPDGSSAVMRTICPSSPAPTRAIFSYRSRTAELRLSYVWLPRQSSSFVLYFDFVSLHRKKGAQQNTRGVVLAGPCEFTCSESGCLSTWSLVCNGVADCPDESDELDCPIPLPSSGSPRSRSDASTGDVFSIQIIIIVIAVVVTLSIFTCVLSHYKMGARSWSEGRTARQHHQPPNNHQTAQVTNPHRFQQERATQLHAANTVLFVSSNTSQERLHRETVSLQDRQTRNKSVQLDLELDLPTSIALPDGEEPYGSMQHVHLRDAEQESEIYRECIRPPPNRTVFEGDSPPLPLPPPYRPGSAGFPPHRSARGTNGGTTTPPPPPPPPTTQRIVRDWNGTRQLVTRCNNNAAAAKNGNGTESGAATSQRYGSHYAAALPTTNSLVAPVARHSASCAPDGEPPPGYSELPPPVHAYGGGSAQRPQSNKNV